MKQLGILITFILIATVISAAPVTPPSPAAPEPEKNGLDAAVQVPLIPPDSSPSPEIEFPEGQDDTLAPGVTLFADRVYKVQDVPAALRGLKFIRSNIAGGRFVCRRPGVVYLLTSFSASKRDSLTAEWLKRGFQQTNIPAFQLYKSLKNPCIVFQKEMTKDEVLNFGEWAVLVLAGQAAKTSELTPATLAANTELLPLWDSRTPFPSFEEMPDLDVVTHVQVERARRGEYHFLHEPAIAMHGGLLYVGWANHPLCEIRTKQDHLLRGRTSRDGGLSWSPVQTWVAPPLLGGESYNHPVIKEHLGKLWGFFTRWEKQEPRVEIFSLNDTTHTWQPREAHIPNFIPLTPPRKMRDGNWILGGELFGWRDAAVAISHGDDFTRWDVVPIPRSETVELMFPETTLFERGDELIAICRPKKGDKTAMASVSRDCGRTWTAVRPSNFPMVDSKPLCGRLSTGQHYLITNSPSEGRTLLSIAVTAPGGDTFRRIWKIRHQATPVRRLLGSPDEGKTMVGSRTEWSYPAAIEEGGKLYVSYSQGKEDCALSIIPLSALAVANDEPEKL